MLLAVAPVETRMVATANKPNMTVSLGLPLGIFSIDIRPGVELGANGSG